MTHLDRNRIEPSQSLEQRIAAAVGKNQNGAQKRGGKTIQVGSEWGV